jgi:hypothetical protein
LRLCLGEQHGWPFYPEQWQPHDYSGYFRWWTACIFHIMSDSPNVSVDVDMWWDNHVNIANPSKGLVL